MNNKKFVYFFSVAKIFICRYKFFGIKKTSNPLMSFTNHSICHSLEINLVNIGYSRGYPSPGVSNSVLVLIIIDMVITKHLLFKNKNGNGECLKPDQE